MSSGWAMGRALSLLVAIVVAGSGLPALALATTSPSPPADPGGSAQPVEPSQVLIGLGGLPLIPLPTTLHPMPGPAAAPDPQNITATVPACGSDGNTPLPLGHAELRIDPLVAGNVDLFAAGFDPGSSIVIRLEAPPRSGNVILLAITQADANGLVRISLVLPATISSTTGLFVLLVFGERHGQGCVGLEAAPSPTQLLGRTTTRSFFLGKNVLDPGGSTSADGQGCAPVSPVAFSLISGGTSIGRTTADGDGNFKGTITIPKNATLGPHTVVATCGDVVQTDHITVVAGGSALPFTGADIMVLLIVALVLLASGAAASAKGRSSPRLPSKDSTGQGTWGSHRMTV